MSKCPRCGNVVLTTAEVPLILTAVGPEAATGIPFGTSFTVDLDTLAVCNRHGCRWTGTVRDLQ